MKLSFASAVVATHIALSSTVADAATSLVTATTNTAAAAPATSAITVGFTTAEAHTAVTPADTFMVTLPETFDAVLTPAAVVSGELEMKCKTSAGDLQAVTLGTHYDVTYNATTRVVTATKKAADTAFCIAGAATLKFLKATIRAKEVAVNSIKVANSKVTAETTTPVTGPAAVAALVPALAGTTQPGAFTTANDAFEIAYTAGADVTSGKVTVALHGYTFAADSVCSVGTDAATTTAGTAVDGYDFVTFDLSATIKFVATEKKVKCTKVTRAAGGTAKAGGVQLWIADNKAGFKDTVASTSAPTTPPPTAATSAPTAATKAPSKAPSKAPTKADHSDASAITASAFVVATTVFASSMFA